MKRRNLLFYFIALALLLLSCNALNPQPNPAAEYGVDRENALFLAAGQPRTLDPALTHGGPDSALGHVFSGLVTLGPDLQVQRDLAIGWDIDPTGTVYTFYLHPEATFHDGRPVTAEDVIYSWERAADPATGSDTATTYLGDIAGIEAYRRGEGEVITGLHAVDEHTLQVTIDAPKPYFLAKLAYPVAFVVDRENVAQPNWERRPNGTGPFRLAVWEDDQVIILERFEAYYGAPAGVPHVVLLMGAGIPLSLYETGQIDLVGIGGGTLDRVQDPNDPLSEEVVTGTAMCTGYVGFDTTRPPFDDVRVRRAFNYAIDRERLVETLLGGNALVADGLLPPGMPGYQTRTAPYPFDPELARELLAAAGYPAANFPRITYYMPGYSDVNAEATVLITMWEENLGVEIEPVLLDPFIYNDELYAGNVGNLFDSGWCADYPDPQNFLDVLFHSGAQANLGRFANAEIDRRLEAARVAPDVSTRLNLYAETETELLEAAPAVFLTHPLTAALVKPYVSNYHLTPIGIAQWQRIEIAR